MEQLSITSTLKISREVLIVINNPRSCYRQHNTSISQRIFYTYSTTKISYIGVYIVWVYDIDTICEGRPKI